MRGGLDETLNFHSQALLLRARRQQLIASNIANADTPGYRARDFDFAAALRAATGNEALRAATGNEAPRAGPQAQPVALLRTAASHLAPAAGESVAGVAVQYRVPAQGSLDGNSVELDAERAQFADNAIRYE
ncbi:MAG: flagellar basal body rod protein FlgB, partial [Burkholderiales bacterium]|nr:flagellar basal body rod protein FlgB [Burkholderiales bacterium]